jgi:cytochrome c oxidase subunit 3
MSAHEQGLAHHFHDLGQQRRAAELAMWVFLATEFMFFGGLFLAYLVYRNRYPDEFASGSQTMDLILGTVNTFVLLASSLTMALAVHASSQSNRRLLILFLWATIFLGTVFLGIKAYEYYHKHHEHHIPFLGLEFHAESEEHRLGLSTFYNLYFLMTGMHALHMIIGLGLLVVLLVLAYRGGLMAVQSIVVHNSGLYWHFVDLVWVYLFPFFYLVAARGG